MPGYKVSSLWDMNARRSFPDFLERIQLIEMVSNISFHLRLARALLYNEPKQHMDILAMLINFKSIKEDRS
jgi:hypothetical protein